MDSISRFSTAFHVAPEFPTLLQRAAHDTDDQEKNIWEKKSQSGCNQLYIGPTDPPPPPPAYTMPKLLLALQPMTSTK